MSGLFSRVSQRVLAPQTSVQPVSGEHETATFAPEIAASSQQQPAVRDSSAIDSTNSPRTAARRQSVAAKSDRLPATRLPRSLQPQRAAAEEKQAEPQPVDLAESRAATTRRQNVRATQVEYEPPAMTSIAEPARAAPQVETRRRERPAAIADAALREVRTQLLPSAASLAAQDRTIAGEAAQAPVINVTIDRIDVHQPPAPPPRALPAARPAPRVSLADYLGGVKQRSS
jgi:hypothetical protein